MMIRYAIPIILVLTVLLPALAQPVAEGTVTPVIAAAKADLAKRLNLPVSDIRLLESKPVMFPDASLGLPERGKMYAQVITPGQIVILTARQAPYVYTVAGNTFRYGGSLGSWRYSALYLEPIENEPNLNGNLMQVSLLGTNPTRLIEGVDDFRPQPDGSIIARRRTSRSGYTLLYLAPQDRSQPVELMSAFYFGDAAVSPDGRRWIAVMRDQVGGKWQVATGGIGLVETAPQRIDLPAEGMPGRVYWTGEGPVITLQSGEKSAYYQLKPGATPSWEKPGYFMPPELERLMLNKSERLDIQQVQVEGKPAVRVSRRWFLGDETVVATVANLQLKEFDMAPTLPIVLLSGMRNDKATGVTVDYRTGEVMETASGAMGTVRLRYAPPQSWLARELVKG